MVEKWTLDTVRGALKHGPALDLASCLHPVTCNAVPTSPPWRRPARPQLTHHVSGSSVFLAFLCLSLHYMNAKTTAVGLSLNICKPEPAGWH